MKQAEDHLLSFFLSNNRQVICGNQTIKITAAGTTAQL